MEITLTLMILELLVCTGSFICSVLQFKLNKNKRSKGNKKITKDKNHKD